MRLLELSELFVLLRIDHSLMHTKEVDTGYSIDQIETAQLAKAIAHPARVAILQLLASQACCYHGNMADELPIAKSTLSQHLNELKKAGLIQGSVTPPLVKYCINQDKWLKAKSLFNGLLETDNNHCS